MPDEEEKTPEQQKATDQQDDTSEMTDQQKIDWQARYKGTGPVIDKLTQEKRALEEQLAKKASELEQLTSQLSIKDVEKDAATGERDKKIQELVQSQTEKDAELKKLRAKSLKIEVANKLGRPDLIKIVDHIPDMEDPEALEIVMKDFADFAKSAADAREKQLMAGVTLTGAGAQDNLPSAPASTDAWMQKINSLPLGSPERKEAMDNYGDWLQKQHEATQR